MNVLGVITARGGSKGLPHKNILPLNGKPLIAWTIDAALGSIEVDCLIVSTDNEKIACVAREYGAEVPFIRPSNLAMDTSNHIDVVIHAIQWWRKDREMLPDYVLLLQPTSPLRMSEDIDNIIAIAQEHKAVAVVSVCEVEHHPYLMKGISSNGLLQDFIASDIAYLRRQDLPTLYALNGALYLCRVDILLEQKTFWPKGKTYAYCMPKERSFDIDTRLDFDIVEMILQRGYFEKD